MSVLIRFKDIMASNIHAMLDKIEDPSKMIDQMLRNAIKDLAEVKKETAIVLAEEKRCYRILDSINKEVARFDGLAMKAVQAGNDQDATIFLQEKAKLSSDLVNAQTTHQAAEANATKMRQMHDKLTTDIQELKRRQGSIKATIAVAKTQQKINKMGGVNADAAVSKFNDYEQKAQNMLDRAEAEASLNAPVEREADRLASKYATSGVDVSGELAALKVSMGMSEE